MYKVLIVDDEVLVRVGLKTTINWEEIGFTVVAEASNGEQGYEQYEKHNPDVIITDIKMPKKDGMWLIRKIRETNQQVKILFLTCYDEFDYVREALKQGANDYILKSEVEDEELMEIMGKIKKEIDAMICQQEKLQGVKEQYKTDLRTQKNQLLNELLNPDVKLSDSLLNQCKEVDFTVEDTCFALVKVVMEEDEIDEQKGKENNQVQNAVMNLACDSMKERKISYLYKQEDTCFTFLLSKFKITENDIQQLLLALQKAGKQYFDLSMSGVMSNLFYDLTQVSFADEEVNKRSAILYYKDASCIIDQTEKEIASIEMFSIKKRYQKQLTTVIGEEKKEKVFEILNITQQYFKKHRANPDDVKLFYSNLLNRVFEQYYDFFKEDKKISNFGTYHSAIMSADKLEKTVESVKNVMNLIIQNIKKYRNNNSKFIITQAILFIENNYGKKISLEDIAAELNLSKHYVCHIFKKETGENISYYINKLRIEKAKEMILKSNCRVKEIYEELGFSDQQYFSKVFKRITGMTIMQYKESILKKV